MNRFLSIFLFVLIGVRGFAAVLQISPGPNSSGKIYLTMRFDGVPLRAFLDTGSAATLVPNSQRFASYPKIGEMSFKSATAVEQAIDKIQLRSIQLDELTLTNPAIFRANYPKAETTLGIDILDHQPFLLSVRRRILRLNPPRPQTPETTLHVSEHGHLSVPLTVGDRNLYALFDTGAGLTTVDLALVRANPDNFQATKKYMQGADGTGRPLLVPLFRARQVRIGNLTFNDVDVGAIDLTVVRRGIAENVQAVLGYNLIRKADWYFDPKTRLWQCERK